MPKHYIVSVWFPKLNLKGNSYRGMKSLEELTRVTEDSIFGNYNYHCFLAIK
ncbi:hypothetical protein EMIT036CA2_50246 [Chryseobacterium sp. IT-36CA2]